MLSFSITYDDGGIQQVFDLSYRMFDLRPLAIRVKEIVEEQNREMRPAGLDRYGVPFVDLADSTWKKRERQGRLGPPLAPDGDASAIVAGFLAQVEEDFPDDITIRGFWPFLPWIKYHVDSNAPRGHLPVRDPAGLPAPAQDRIVEAFDDFMAGLIAQTY
jgi:hypothetical protein